MYPAEALAYCLAERAIELSGIGFGVVACKPEDTLEPVHMDLAASVQRVTEKVILRLTRTLAAATSARNLCLADGVALNCVANGKVSRDGRFEEVGCSQPPATLEARSA